MRLWAASGRLLLQAAATRPRAAAPTRFGAAAAATRHARPHPHRPRHRHALVPALGRRGALPGRPAVARGTGCRASSGSASGGGDGHVPAAPTTTRPAATKFTVRELRSHHRKGLPITMCTAYDFSSARCVAEAKTDILLVGDSYGMVVLGHETTKDVTMADMERATGSVDRARCDHHQPLVVSDLPFGTYLTEPAALENGARLIRAGAHMVKLEGGAAMAGRIRALVDNGIPVMGHIGLLPQTATSLGGYRVQGTTPAQAARLLEDALALQEAGCSAVVLEMVVAEVAEAITQHLKVPTIGIGAGPSTSGQVLVFHDLCGLYDTFVPRFAKQYGQAGPVLAGALESFNAEVREGAFPGPEHTVSRTKDGFRDKVEAAVAGVMQARGLTKPAPRGPAAASGAAAAPGARRSMSTSAVARGAGLQGPGREIRKVVVIGGGALGSLYAGMLTRGGVAEEVWMVTSWGDQVRAVSEHGLTIRGPGGEEEAACQVGPISAVLGGQLAPVTRSGLADLVLVLVKSGSTARAARIARRVVHPDGTIVSLQNGMGNLDAIRGVVGRDLCVLGGVTSNGVTVLGPGHIQRNGVGVTSLAAAPSGHAALERIEGLLEASGLGVEVSTQAGGLAALQWRKLVVNSAINPITALLDAPNGKVVAEPWLELATHLARETVAVGRHLHSGLVFPDDPVGEVQRVAALTAQNISSMLSDVRRGVPTEVDAINGYVVRQGRRLGVPTPANRAVLGLIKSRSQSRRWNGPVPGLAGLPAMLSRGMATGAAATTTPPAAAMQVAHGIPEFEALRRALPAEGVRIGLVPTMGALHDGHLSLVRMAREQSDVVVTSIFVNPLQFAAGEDLDVYPTRLDADLAECEAAGTDIVLMPSQAEMYPERAAASILMGDATHKAEGASRPHFFNGVATVCAKLFNIVRPHAVFFGQKDAQQCATIRQLVLDLNFPIDVVIGDTVREPDGLAMSSRNLNLTAEHRLAAPALFDALQAMASTYGSGERSVDRLKAVGARVIETQPLLRLQYVTVADALSLADHTDTVSGDASGNLCFAVAAMAGDVRLIDNIIVEARS